MHPVKYYYKPIAYYRGAVLKCAGISTETNGAWFKQHHPDAIVLDDYRGDRIRASDYSEFIPTTSDDL